MSQHQQNQIETSEDRPVQEILRQKETELHEALTESKRQEQASQLLASIVSSADDAILSKTLDGIITTWNKSAELLFGYSPEEAIGRPITIITPDDRTAEEQSILNSVRLGQRIEHYETVRRKKDGTVVPVFLSVSPVRDGSGRIVGAASIARDITQQQQAESARRASEQNFRMLADNMSQLAWMADERGAIFWFNRRWLDYTGASSTDMNGWGWQSMIHPDHAQRVVETLRQSFLTGNPWDDIFQLRGHDGQYRWFLSNALPIRDETGKIVRWLGTNTDVTEQRRAREELAKSEHRLRSALSAAHGGAWEWDIDQDRFWGSTELYELWRIPPETPMRLADFLAAIQPEDRERMHEAIEHAITEHSDCRCEFRICHPQGGKRWMVSIGRPMYAQSGSPARLYGITLDIHEIKQTETALQKTREELVRTNEMLERKVQERTAKLQESIAELELFSYTLTHDMRAPLRAMQGFASIVMMDSSNQLGPESHEYLRRIADSADRMDQLITDALQYSLLVRGRFDLEPVDTGALLRGILESYPQYRPPDAIVHIAPNLPVVFANEAGLTQCFSNLLSNAVKFAKPGQTPEIRIWSEAISPKPGENAQQYVRLWFEDNGIGIDRQYQQQIWTMFQRLNPDHDGTGIGLALVRKAVERMEGRAGVESEPGVGSRFWLELKIPGEGVRP